MEIERLLKELQVQIALGVLPNEYKLHRIKDRKPYPCGGRRTCNMCGDPIQKGELYYDLGSSTHTNNACMDCSYISIVKFIKTCGRETNA